MFTRRLFPGEQRPGYEFLGFLLLLQIATQSYLSLTSTKSESNPTTTLVENVLSPPTEDKDVVEQTPEKSIPTEPTVPPDVNLVLDLADETILPYIPQGSRRCPLCLDPMKDPTAAECGHLFCWTCILRWTGESVGRGECPICRGQCGREGLLRLAG
jgi:peroxin-10